MLHRHASTCLLLTQRSQKFLSKQRGNTFQLLNLTQAVRCQTQTTLLLERSPLGPHVESMACACTSLSMTAMWSSSERSLAVKKQNVFSFLTDHVWLVCVKVCSVRLSKSFLSSPQDLHRQHPEYRDCTDYKTVSSRSNQDSEEQMTLVKLTSICMFSSSLIVDTE